MSTVPHPDRDDAEINTEETEAMLVQISVELDKMPSDADEAKNLHNWLQDRLMPALRKMHNENDAGLYYLGMHEDRIGALEEAEEGMLAPDDAVHLLAYIRETLNLLETLQKEAKIPNLDILISHGKECQEIVEEFLPPEEDDDDQQETRKRKH